VRTYEHIRKLLAWYNGEDKDLKKIELSVSMEWKIVSLAHKFKQISREAQTELFKKQAVKDPSDSS